MNYGELKAAVAQYMGTDDLTTEIVGFVERAEARIGRDLRAQENQRLATATTNASGQIEIGWDAGGGFPNRVAEICSVSTGSGSTLRFLDPIDKTQSGNYAPSGDALAYYTYGNTGTFDLDQARLQTVPAAVSVELSIIYWETPESLEGDLAGDAAVRPLLTRFPNLYIDGACAEASISLRDFASADWFTGRFDAAIEKANRAYLQRYPLRSTTAYNYSARRPRGV